MNLLTGNVGISFLCIAALCLQSHAEDFVPLAVVQDKRINESSGLAISYANPDALWVHNDSGDAPRLYLLGLDGVTQAVVNISGARAHDWEDVCSFQIDGQSWLLIGDVGDNTVRRGKGLPGCRLYLIKEPVIPRSNGLPTISWQVSATIDFQYDHGPANCEGVAVDVERQEILLLTKTLAQCGLYQLPLDLRQPRQQLTARRIATAFFPAVTALDISPDSRTMAIGTMFDGLVVRRTVDQTWAEALDGRGTVVPLPPRKQGESICFDTTGRWLYLNSEKSQQPLWRVKP